MTAQIIRPARFNRGPAIRAVHPVDEALSLLRRAELKAGVEASEAVADELEKLRAVVEEMLAGERSIL